MRQDRYNNPNNKSLCGTWETEITLYYSVFVFRKTKTQYEWPL